MLHKYSPTYRRMDVTACPTSGQVRDASLLSEIPKFTVLCYRMEGHERQDEDKDQLIQKPDRSCLMESSESGVYALNIYPPEACLRWFSASPCALRVHPSRLPALPLQAPSTKPPPPWWTKPCSAAVTATRREVAARAAVLPTGKCRGARDAKTFGSVAPGGMRRSKRHTPLWALGGGGAWLRPPRRRRLRAGRLKRQCREAALWDAQRAENQRRQASGGYIFRVMWLVREEKAWISV